MPAAIETFFEGLGAQGQRAALRAGSRCLSYAELRAAVDERTAQLAAYGARRVALALDNGIDWVVWDLALMASGLIAVPVPGFFSPAQQRHVLDDAGVDLLVGGGEALAHAAGFESLATGLWRREVAQPPQVPAGTAKITYTSGTTGQPKGVCLDAATLLTVAHSLWVASRDVAVERHLCVLPLATLLENVAGVYAPLMGGACVDLPPLAEVGLSGASGLDLRAFLACLGTHQPHSLILLPQLLLALVGAKAQSLPVPASLRFVAVGGGRVSPALLTQAQALGIPVFEGYGLSECASVVCLNTPSARRIGTVGQPLTHVQVRLADDGEVLVRGPRMLGYLGEPASADAWWPTGDLGHFDEAGFLVLHGRKKHMFITAYGRNVNPEWVEAELTQQPAIAQAWLHGEALPRNVALLVPRGPAVTDAALAAAVAGVNATLPDYARVHHWRRAPEPFTPANGLATPNGRLRRPALLARYGAMAEALAQTPDLQESPAP